MKNLAKLFGIIVIVTIIGFYFIACDNGGGDNGDNNNSGNTPSGNDPGSVQSFSFPSQLKNTMWKKDGTTAGYNFVWIRFNTDSVEFTFQRTDGSMSYESAFYVDSMNGNTYHMKSGGTFTATVSGNKLTTTSSSWGSSVIGTFTKQQYTGVPDTV